MKTFRLLLAAVFCLTLRLSAADAAPALVETKDAVDKLPPLSAYEPANNTVVVELSKYAGYAGLVMANGGLEASENSVFFRRFGFKVKINLSEEESWAALNQGRMAASATTVDVLAAYGRQLQVSVPAQIGYSRGADALVTRSSIKSLKDLRGKTVVAAQFTESDFFLRYLANESGIPVLALREGMNPERDRINVVFAGDAFAAGDLFLADLKSGKERYAACVTWNPKTSEVIQESGGRARVLASNQNILVVADILIVNKGFEKKYPALVRGLVEGMLEGNQKVREQPAACVSVVGRAFGWDAQEAKAELAKVHLSNLPENLAFFKGDLAAGGSFDYIYQMAGESYGPQYIPNPGDPDLFKSLKHLAEIERGGRFASQVPEILPLLMEASSPVETTPIDKDLRFQFAPNDARLDPDASANGKYIESLAGLLRAGVGSRILLIGHVEGSMIPQFRQKGEAYLKAMDRSAVSLSRNRAKSVKDTLVEKYGITPERIETTGKGWTEPLGAAFDLDRRVQAQWVTVN